METLVGYGSMYICPSSSSIMPLKKLKKRYKYLKLSEEGNEPHVNAYI